MLIHDLMSPVGPRKIVLHAGFPKTGTTYLQNKLFANRKALAEKHAIILPGATANLTNALCTMFHDNPMVHVSNALLQYSLDQVSAVKKNYFIELERDLIRPEWTTAILSAEGVVNLNSQELARLKAWGDRYCTEWEVIFCIRNSVDWVRSVIQELVKGGRTLEDLYSDLPLPHFRKRIEAAMSIFGRDAIRVYSFEAAQAQPAGILGHLLSLVDIDLESLSSNSEREVRENVSMSREAVTILDRLNVLRPLFDHNGKLGKQRTGREIPYLLQVKGSPFRLPPSVESRVRAEVESDEQWLNDTFGVRSETPQSDAREISNSAPFPEESIDSLALLVSNLLNEIAQKKFLQEVTQAAASDNISSLRTLSEKVKTLPYF